MREARAYGMLLVRLGKKLSRRKEVGDEFPSE